VPSVPQFLFLAPSGAGRPCGPWLTRHWARRAVALAGAGMPAPGELPLSSPCLFLFFLLPQAPGGLVGLGWRAIRRGARSRLPEPACRLRGSLPFPHRAFSFFLAPSGAGRPGGPWLSRHWARRAVALAGAGMPSPGESPLSSPCLFLFSCSLKRRAAWSALALAPLGAAHRGWGCPPRPPGALAACSVPASRSMRRGNVLYIPLIRNIIPHP
jgi:hypothetical protein